MRGMSLTIEIIGGSSFDEAFRDARDLSLQLDIMIEYSFNGVTMIVIGSDTVHAAYKFYNTETKGLLTDKSK